MDHYAGQFLVFLATIDPIGTLALIVGFTANASPADRSRIALRAVGYAAVILIAAVVVGQLLLGSLGIRLASFQLAGGIIFFLFGVQMVFGTGAAAAPTETEAGRDVAIFPLAVPSLASPGAILAAVVLTDNREFSLPEQALSGALLLLVLGITLVLLLQANRIFSLIGNAGSSLLVKVLGLILSALAVEMILASVGELLLDMPAV